MCTSRRTDVELPKTTGKSAGWIWSPWPCDKKHVGRRRIPTGPVTPSAEEKELHKTSGHAPYRRWCRWCAAVRTADEPHLREQQAETGEAMSRIEFDFAEFEREEDQTSSTSSPNFLHDRSESSTATLCSTKTFSEYLTKTTVAFVEVLGHDVVLLHTDQEPLVVHLLKNRTEQTSDRNVGETWSKNQSSEPEQD